MKITCRIRFNKVRLMRYISHLDLMRLFIRAARRAGLPLYMSKGFSPHPIVRIKKALKLGAMGFNEEAEFILTEKIEAADFKKCLIEQLPDGIEIETVEVVS